MHIFVLCSCLLMSIFAPEQDRRWSLVLSNWLHQQQDFQMLRRDDKIHSSTRIYLRGFQTEIPNAKIGFDTAENEPFPEKIAK